MNHTTGEPWLDLLFGAGAMVFWLYARMWRGVQWGYSWLTRPRTSTEKAAFVVYSRPGDGRYPWLLRRWLVHRRQRAA